MITIVSIILVGLLIAIRGIELFIFLKRVNKLCKDYDWKYIDEFGTPLAEVIELGDDYIMKCEWSAYNFLFMKGPNPLLMFFSLKPLTIEGQYNENAIDKLKKYELI